MGEGERGSEQEMLELSLKGVHQEGDKRKDVLAKKCSTCKSVREGVYVQMCGKLKGNWD